MKHFFSSFPRVIIANFTGARLVWNIIAMAVTYVIVASGIDWYYFLHTRQDILRPLFFPAIALGGMLPIFVPLFLIIGGYAARKKRVELSGWALGQAALAGSLISSAYKAFTGRLQPNIDDITNNISTNFDFGFWNNGIFWGWPSSHTTIAFAMAFALIGLYPKNRTIAYASIIYALYVGIGVSFSIHWLSDFVAGAIIGTVIGIIVGKDFQKAFL